MGGGGLCSDVERLENFQLNTEVYVFGYGSLTSIRSVAATLGHPIEASRFRYARLPGWTRSWCVGSDKRSHPERTFLLPDGEVYKGLLVSLGIEPHPHGECDGAVFPVSQGDLSPLDVRERNYTRIDVSDRVTWAGKPGDCTVYTYVPREEARARVTEAIAAGRDVCVRRGYLALVREGFDGLGHEDRHRDWETPPYRIEDLRIETNPDLTPSSVTIGYSPYPHTSTPPTAT